MKKSVKYLLILFIGSLSFSLLIYYTYFGFFPNNGNKNGENLTGIPSGYYQNLKLNEYYVYNITEFGNSSIWGSFPEQIDESNSSWQTTEGGEIRIQFTGFYNPSFSMLKYNPLEGKKIPYLNIEIREKKNHIISQNFTLNNITNHEASYNLNIGYNIFRLGFLIPYTNISHIKDFAYSSNDSGDNSSSGVIHIEETYDFLFIGFNLNDSQNPDSNSSSYLTYDKHSGLLVRFKTQIKDYKLNMFLSNYTFDTSRRFKYEVEEFENPINITNWYLNKTYGIINSNPTGRIHIKISDYYLKSPNDMSLFESPIPYIEIDFIENKSQGIYEDYEIGYLKTNASLINISNTELANSFGLGYNKFDSGFIIPVNNLSELKTQVISQNESSGWEANINIIETKLTITFLFNNFDKDFNITLVYDKFTGLLQFSNVNRSDGLIYKFEIIDFDPLIKLESVTLIIIHSDGNQDIWANFSMTIEKNTVYDALIMWCNVGYKDYGQMGYLITSIDGDTGDWLYSINEGYVGAAANKVELKNQDIIKWWRINI